ncbi:HTH-type transcriptional regulator RutR [Herbaspirillum lusitanum]|uniref:HTH-type transcriptional regulator RutR n=1 Tax=Herbaspirillum lusitanum TaxID=213312 RepID=A0ABW9AEV7_9BURK
MPKTRRPAADQTLSATVPDDATAGLAAAAPAKRPRLAAKAAPRKRAERAPAVRSEAAIGRRQRQIEAKRESITSAALALFSRFGLHGTSLDQVAQRADVSKTNLLYYFPNKEDLYLAVLRDLLAVWLAPLRAFQADQDPEQAIGDYIRGKLANSRDNPEASRLFCMEVLQGAPLLHDELGHELRDLVEAKSEVIRAWVADGRLAPVEPHHFLFALWSTTQHYADFSVQVHALTGRTLDEPAFFEQAVANVQHIVLHGVLTRATSG